MVEQAASYSSSEMMSIVAARRLDNRMVCFVGIGLPSEVANLARLTHAPELVLIYESGTIGSKPDVLPLSIGDGELASTAVTVVGGTEIFAYWLQGGRIDVGFLSAAQIDRFANLNSTVVGSYEHPQIRLPGAGGAPEIAGGAGQVFVMLKQNRRSFVERVDFVTTPGFGRDGAGVPGRTGRGPTVVFTDLGILEPDPETHELVLTSIHPGLELSEVKGATGWDLKVSSNLVVTDAPTRQELEVLRDLLARTATAHR